jgi:hypothetical protein
MGLSDHIRDLRPHAEWRAIEIVIVACIGGGGVTALRFIVKILGGPGWALAALISAAISGLAAWYLTRPRKAGRAKEKARTSEVGGTPDRLRQYVAGLAGDLFAVLIEVGEKLEAPIITSDRYMETLLRDPDPRVTTRASERKIEGRLKDAYLRARDIGVLPGCVSWSTSIEDVGEVRARIWDLGILSEALRERFPDLPVGSG